jgi:hypothetical protein
MFFTSSSKMEASRPILLDPSQRANQLQARLHRIARSLAIARKFRNCFTGPFADQGYSRMFQLFTSVPSLRQPANTEKSGSGT